MSKNNKKLNKVPHLIRVAVGARPNLDQVSARRVAVGQIHALAVIRPGDTLVTGHVPLLVGVSAVARPGLQFLSGGGIAAGDVEALVAEDAESSTGVGPLLVVSAGAALDSDSSSIRVRCGEALSAGVSWANRLAGGVSGWVASASSSAVSALKEDRSRLAVTRASLSGSRAPLQVHEASLA